MTEEQHYNIASNRLYIDSNTFYNVLKKKGITISLAFSVIPKQEIIFLEDNPYFYENANNIFISADQQIINYLAKKQQVQTCFLNTGVNDCIDITPTYEIPIKQIEKIKELKK